MPCSVCRKSGHNIRTCPEKKVAEKVAEKVEKVAEKVVAEKVDCSKMFCSFCNKYGHNIETCSLKKSLDSFKKREAERIKRKEKKMKDFREKLESNTFIAESLLSYKMPKDLCDMIEKIVVKDLLKEVHQELRGAFLKFSNRQYLKYYTSSMTQTKYFKMTGWNMINRNSGLYNSREGFTKKEWEKKMNEPAWVEENTIMSEFEPCEDGDHEYTFQEAMVILLRRGNWPNCCHIMDMRI